MKRLTVEDLMTTAVITLRPGDTVGRLREEMALADVRHIPVVDERNRVVGIVSNRDLHRAAGRAHGPRRVADVMTAEVVTVNPWTPAHHAAAMLIERKISSLPVVGETQEIVGVITATDLLEVAYEALRGVEPRARAET